MELHRREFLKYSSLAFLSSIFPLWRISSLGAAPLTSDHIYYPVQISGGKKAILFTYPASSDKSVIASDTLDILRLHSVVPHPTQKQILALCPENGTEIIFFDRETKSIHSKIPLAITYESSGHGCWSVDGQYFFAGAYNHENSVVAKIQFSTRTIEHQFVLPAFSIHELHIYDQAIIACCTGQDPKNGALVPEKPSLYKINLINSVVEKIITPKMQQNEFLTHFVTKDFSYWSILARKREGQNKDGNYFWLESNAPAVSISQKKEIRMPGKDYVRGVSIGLDPKSSVVGITYDWTNCILFHELQSGKIITEIQASAIGLGKPGGISITPDSLYWVIGDRHGKGISWINSKDYSLKNHQSSGLSEGNHTHLAIG